jgi:Uma2 family endonuclease
MAVMEVPRVKHPAPAPRGVEPAPEPEDDLYADLDAPLLDHLEALYESLDEIPGHRIELLAGQIVVSPMAVRWHARVCTWLFREFDPACLANGWDQYQNAELRLAPTREITIPDQLVIKGPDTFTDQEPATLAEYALLVSEVVSPSGKRTDRELKRRSYAKAGIPFYVLVDRFVKPMTITLFSEPVMGNYAKSEVVPAGPGGGKLYVPEPFNLTLDATAMPMPIKRSPASDH